MLDALPEKYNTLHCVILFIFKVNIYFAQLTSVVIVYQSGPFLENDLQQQYLESVQQAFQNQSRNGNGIGLQWIKVSHSNDNREQFEEKVLNAVNLMVVEVKPFKKKIYLCPTATC